jgi:hypothetical protein
MISLVLFYAIRKSDRCVSLVSTATLTYDTLRFAEFEDFPETSEPVWILGRKYSIFTGTGLPGATPLCFCRKHLVIVIAVC